MIPTRKSSSRALFLARPTALSSLSNPPRGRPLPFGPLLAQHPDRLRSFLRADMAEVQGSLVRREVPLSVVKASNAEEQSLQVSVVGLGAEEQGGRQRWQEARRADERATSRTLPVATRPL